VLQVVEAVETVMQVLPLETLLRAVAQMEARLQMRLMQLVTREAAAVVVEE
jgi:hypothetical protein